jgi:hypothetical protein
MTYLTNLADVVRSAGLKVVEVDGWKTRGRPASSGPFDPVGVLCHHTASNKASSDAAVIRLLVGGRSDLPGPLCQLGLARDGTVYVIAAGRANHAGTARSSGTVAAGDGNRLYIGIEAFNDGVGEPWPEVQLNAYARLCAVLSVKITHNSVNTVRGHKETSVTGKIDPTFNMDTHRARVAREMERLTAPPKPEPTPEPPAPPLPAKPPHDPFTVGLLPGRWDAPLKAWLDRHREVRDQAAQIVTLTEGTRPALVEDFTRALNQIAGEGPLFWDVYHDPTPGPANIIHTWDGNRFEQVGIPWKVQLDTIQIWSKKGFARPNTYAVGIALRDKQADKVILLVGAHLPLENTVRRRKAKEEALAVLKDKAFDSGRAQFPDSVRMFACDWNRRAHKQTVRDWFKATWPGLAASWATRAVRTQGPDWVAAGTRLVNLESVVLPRTKGDPLDHTTKVTRWGWR